MKKISLKNRLFAVTMLTVLLTNCSYYTQTEDTTIPDRSMSSEEETQAAEEKTEELLQPSHAEVTLLDTKPIIDENAVQYGNLHITLPDGVTAQQQESENDAVVIDLIGAESLKEGDKCKDDPFAPRIWLANYHVEYENGRLTLISALLDLLPGVSLGERYTSGEGCNLFTYYKPYQYGYILQYEDDIYLVEEIGWESYYSFGRLLDRNAVQWKDSTCAFGDRSRYSNQFYDKLNTAHDRTFLTSQTVTKGRRSILLYRDGYFSTLYQNITYYEWDRDVVFEDRNFDGCLDIVTSTTSMYLWNADKKMYEAAQLPEEFIDQWHREFFPETKTIWSHDFEIMSEYDEETEILWKWEGAALVKQRECRTQVREKDVRLLAYEAGSQNTLFDETFSIEAWEQNSIDVQKRFEQFYAQMVPEGADGYFFHTINYNQESEIPQALLDQLTNALLDETEQEALETLKVPENHKILTKDEIFVLAKDDLMLRCDVLWAEAWNDYMMIMADADNDGISDIVAQIYSGGTAGFVEYVFYKGQEDGTYQKTSSYDAVMEAFSMIFFDEKNYLCRMTYDYSKKTDNGLCIVCYVDGVQVQAAELTLFAKGYDVELTECAEEAYRAYAEEILQNSLEYQRMVEEDRKIIGSSEEKSPLEEHEYQCDLDNDKEPEQYSKSIWEPSNMGTSEHLNLYGEGEGLAHLDNALLAAEGAPIMMWAEPFAEKNIINVISRTGLCDFEITGFLLNGAAYTKIYRICAKAEYGVEQKSAARMRRVNHA